MQVFGLPGHIIRSARGASRLLAAQTPNIEAARRRDALARWRNAMAQGLSSQQGAEAGASLVHPLPLAGARRSPEPSATPGAPTPASTRSGRSRRAPAPGSPHVGQGKARADPAQTGLPHIQRHRRADHRRAHPARNGSARSRPDPQSRRQSSAKEAPPRHPKTQGRYLRKARRRRPDRHPLDLSAARRLHQAFQRLRSLRQMDRRQAVQTSHCQKRRRVPRRGPRTNARSRQSHSKSTAAPSSWPSSSKPAPTRTCPSTSCPPDRQSSTELSSVAMEPGATSSTPAPISQRASTKSPKWSAPSKTSTTTTDPTQPLQEKPQPSTSLSAEPTKLPRLICPEPGHRLDANAG